MQWRLLALIYVLFCGPVQAQVQNLVVGGTSSAEPLIKILFAAFVQEGNNATLQLISPPLGSGGAIKALISGKIDLALTGRVLDRQETAMVSPARQFATTPFVMVSNGGQKARGFMLNELADIYAGRYSVWENGKPIRLVLRTRNDSDTSMLKTMSAAMENAVIVADQRPGMVYGTDDADTLALLKRTPGSLGPSHLGLLRTTSTDLTVFAINGVTPTVAHLKDGSYPWHKTMSVVLSLKPSAVAEKFTRFLYSEKAQALMLQYDFLPLPP